jgi:site-specific recombinase XerD
MALPWLMSGESIELSSASVTPILSGDISDLQDRAEAFVRAAKAPSTHRAYRSDWVHFEAWCLEYRLLALPAEPATVALYITHLASCRSAGTITRRLTSITKAHQSVGFDTPATTRHIAVGETLKGVRRTIGTVQKCKSPLLTKDLKMMIELLPDGLIGIRDRALLLIAYSGGFRRSELAGLKMEDADFTEDGLIVTLRRSKTDQAGQGRKVGIPQGLNPETCPVRSLREWLLVANIQTGALFREVSRHGQVGRAALHSDSVAYIVKRAAGRAGIVPSTVAAHSLRAGLATQAAMNGASELAIMKQTGHRSLTMVRRYIRDGEMWRKNASASLGL